MALDGYFISGIEAQKRGGVSYMARKRADRRGVLPKIRVAVCSRAWERRDAFASASALPEAAGLFMFIFFLRVPHHPSGRDGSCFSPTSPGRCVVVRRRETTATKRSGPASDRASRLPFQTSRPFDRRRHADRSIPKAGRARDRRRDQTREPSGAPRRASKIRRRSTTKVPARG